MTRADCARAAAYALAKFVPGRRTLDVTGPEALTSEQIAAIVTELTGKAIKHVSVPASALIEGMVAHGMPKPVAELYASFDLGIAKGDLATVTQNVSQLTGTGPQSIKAFLMANRAALSPKS